VALEGWPEGVNFRAAADPSCGVFGVCRNHARQSLQIGDDIAIDD
jgi:glutamate synthase domain-containing protein 1